VAGLAALTSVKWDNRPGSHLNAAGMDIGASAIVVAVPPERAAEPVRRQRELQHLTRHANKLGYALTPVT